MKFNSLRHVPIRLRTIKSTVRGFIYWILCLISTKPTVTQWIDETSIRYTVPLNTFFSRYLCKYQTYEPVITNILIDIFSKNKEGLYVDDGLTLDGTPVFFQSLLVFQDWLWQLSQSLLI